MLREINNRNLRSRGRGTYSRMHLKANCTDARRSADFSIAGSTLPYYYDYGLSVFNINESRGHRYPEKNIDSGTLVNSSMS